MNTAFTVRVNARKGGEWMNNAVVRIESLEITNFKNVGHGCLKLENEKKESQSSVLGLYGQNGSGKTALIDALELLRLAFSGRPVPVYFADCVNVDSDHATIKYGLKVQNLKENVNYAVFYEVSIRRDVEEIEQNTEQPIGEITHKATLFDEVLSYAYEGQDTKIRLSPLIDTRTSGRAFTPKTKYEQMMGKSKETETNLLVAKQLANASSRSFIFSKEFLNQLRQNCKEDHCRFLMESLVLFGNYELFVITTRNAGLISMDVLPLVFNYGGEKQLATGSILVSLDKPSPIHEEALSVVRKVVDNMNIALQQLVPGLTIAVKELGKEILPNGVPGCRIQLVSRKNSKEIPLQYESDGIKKLISVLQLLIAVYNKPSITVAIDELDSGVFEYLLGEVLHIVSERGKGQLIFTSHNLRPLETLDKGFIAFTTTNPMNRYIRMNNVKATNNLRDLYYRNIVLDEQKEPVYEPTNNSEIALAFRRAGTCDGL